MTFNIAHARGHDGRVDVKRIAEIIEVADADIVALQEVDRWTARAGKLDLIVELSERTGLTYAFGKTIDYDGGEYGNAFLVRFPILEEEHYLYQTSNGEQRGLLTLVLDVRGREIVVLNTHLDHRNEDAVRFACVEELIAKIRRHKPKAVLVCGDFNDIPESRTIQHMKTEFEDCWESIGTGAGLTYPAELPTKRIDYVFVIKKEHESAWRPTPAAARVLPTHASDHRPLLIEFTL
jgi:endonuclease/exonuclease/phosphatase family metal-dependent hydrolase